MFALGCIVRGMLKVDVWESQKISEVEAVTNISAMRIIYWSAVLTQSAG
jgi:hypothetical protein